MMAGFYGLAMLFYTPTTYPGQETAQEVRPGLVGALMYAPRAYPGGAVGCSAAALEANCYVVCVAYGRGAAAVGHCVMSIHTDSN